MEEQKVKKITVGWFLGWILGTLVLLSGITLIFSYPLIGILTLFLAMILLPPVNNLISMELGFKISGGLKFLLVVILLGIIGAMMQSKHINANSSSSLPISPTSIDSDSSTSKIYAMHEPVKVGYFTYEIESVKKRKSLGNAYMSKVADGAYWIIKMKITNTDTQTRTLDSSMFSIVNDAGTQYDPSSENQIVDMMNGDTGLLLKQFQPNITSSGKIVFEVPENMVDGFLVLSGGFANGDSQKVKIKAE